MSTLVLSLLVLASASCGPTFVAPARVDHLDDTSFPVVVTTLGASDGDRDIRFSVCREPATRRATPDYAFDLVAATRVRIDVVGAGPVAQALVMDATMTPIGCGGSQTELDLGAGTYYVFVLGRAGRAPWELHLERAPSALEAQEATDAEEIERRRQSHASLVEQMEDSIEAHRRDYRAREDSVEGTITPTAPLVLTSRAQAGRCYRWYLVMPVEPDPRTIPFEITFGDQRLDLGSVIDTVSGPINRCVDHATALTVTIGATPAATGTVVLRWVSWTAAAAARVERADAAAEARDRRDAAAELRRDPEARRAVCEGCQDELADCASIPRATRITRDCESAFRRCLDEAGLSAGMCAMPRHPGAR